jgi:hypothetical protein
MPDEDQYNDESAKNLHDKFLKRIGKPATILSEYPELSARVDYPMEIVTNVRNISSLRRSSMMDRGGLIQVARKNQRVSPCYAPYKHLVIDWDGSIVVCCQVRSDATDHIDAVVGRIGAAGVDLIGAYVKLGQWRRSLKTFGAKDGPCASCEFGAYSSTAINRTLSTVLSDIRLPFRNLLQSTFKPILGKRNRW